MHVEEGHRSVAVRADLLEDRHELTLCAVLDAVGGGVAREQGGEQASECEDHHEIE